MKCFISQQTLLNYPTIAVPQRFRKAKLDEKIATFFNMFKKLDGSGVGV